MSISTASMGNASCKRCAFCKYWNDRQDTHIRHKKLDIWEYESKVREYCSQKRHDTVAFDSCSKFELKL